VLKDFSREYTGLDTLIRTDGYYYHEDSDGLHEPFTMSKYGEFQILYVQYKNQNRIQEGFRNDNDKSGIGRGSYTLSGDTIKARWAMSFQYDCYEIFSQQYLIVNDTTLNRIRHLCETSPGREGKARDGIYKFYKYPVEMK
jgi:phosphate-selective porin